MAASVQERLKLKRITLDTWSTREKLALASSVQRSGDQNWSCVSRNIRGFADSNRPADWFSQKNCAQQYASLLENVETPKRKKRIVGYTEKTEVDTPGESIVKKLTAERIEELKKTMAETQTEYLKLLDEVNAIALGEADDRIPYLVRELEEEKVQKELEKQAQIKWLKEREERKLELERAWKPGVHIAHLRRTSSLSEPSSDADSPVNELLNVDVPEETLAPKPTPTSPLLTSLLKSPASVNPSSSSILHSAITSPMRGVSPTIANLLNSSPGSPQKSIDFSVNLAGALGIPPANQSSNLKNLVSSAIGGYQMEEAKPVLPQTPSQGAPTLSMLLELPPSMPGKPLPMIQPPAPPPYTEHLGPPPPYSLATEYLQKQKAEQAAQAQLASSPQKPLQVAEVFASLPKPSSTSPIVEVTTPELEQIKLEPEVPTDPALKEPEQAKVEELSPVKEAKTLPHSTSDHNYVDIQPEAPKIAEEPTEKSDSIVPKTPEKTITTVTPTGTKEVSKPEKKAELDVFEFDEQEEVSGDVEDAKLSYLKSNAQRLAKKEAEASIRAETLRKSTETRIVDDEMEKVVDTECSSTLDEVEKIVEVKEETTVNNEIELTTPVTEDVSAVETELKGEEEQSKAEDFSEIIAAAPDDVVLKEDSDSRMEKEELEESDLPKNDDTLPQSSLLDFSTTEDEKSNEAPARVPGTKRRGTLSLSASDSVPNSPTPVTEEEREYKAWKKSVLLILRRMMGHKSSSLFLKPITDDQAPGYSTIVLRPMDLTTLKRNIEGGVIRTTDEFQRDVMLMFFNAAMFNKNDSVVYQMAADMNKDIMEHIQMLLQATGGNQPSRRETRTQDKGEGKTRTLRLSTKMDSKRKRTSTSTSSDQARKKIKVEDS